MVTKRAMRANTKQARLLDKQLGPPLPRLSGASFCPLCYRPLVSGPSVDEHHLTPRSQGGKDRYRIHKVCHRKIHEALSEKELARRYASWESLRQHPEIAAFVDWVKRRPPEFL